MVDRTDFLAKLTEEDRKLIKLFQDEVDRINLLYMKAIHSNDMTKANQLLKQIKKISNYLSQEYGKRAEVRLPQEYVKGTSYIDEVLEMDIVLENLSKQSIEAYLDELGPIHIEAVNALVDNSKNYVRSSLDGMERQALTMINELQQTQVREELAKGIISGEAKSNDRLIDYFTSQGISGFKDRGGKYWSMDRYVDMLCRTETSIANTQGTINRGLELGITKFGIVEHPDCCEVCAEMNGDIVDIRDGVVELPPFHPNCRGYIVAIVDEEEWKKSFMPEENDKPLTPEERVKKALDVIENSTMYLDKEQAAIVNMNGEIVRMTIGRSGSVCLPRHDIKEPYIFTHNHPNSSSFSRSDLVNRGNMDYQYELRASCKLGTYSIYAEKEIDKILFMKKYLQLERSATRRGKADMRNIATSRKSGSTNDFIKFKDGTTLYYKDSPLEFDKTIDEHFWKYFREATQEAADYVPGVEFKFIETDGVVKNTELNQMYIDKVKELDKTRRTKNIEDKDGIDVNKYL